MIQTKNFSILILICLLLIFPGTALSAREFASELRGQG
jgi:hypothetical protein